MNKWQSKRIFEFCKVKGGKRLPAGEEFADGITPFPYLRVVDMGNGTINPRKLVYVKPEIEPLIRNYKIYKDDIYVTIAGTLGMFGTIPDYLDSSQLTENAAKLCEINQTDFSIEYLKYYLNSNQIQSQLKKEIGIGSGVPKLALFRIEQLIVNFPDKTNQNKIAKILSVCDGVIEKTEEAIAKYKSIKQGMLQDLFIRGIDLKSGKLRPRPEDSPELYKESELGLVPIEWDDPDILSTTYLKGRIGWQGLRADEFIEEGPYLITGTDFENGKINWSSCYHITEKRYLEAPSIHIQNGDVLITKDGTIGKLAYVESCLDKAILNSGVFVMRPLNEVYYGKYFFYMLNSEIFQKWLRVYKGGSTILHLYQREFEKFNFPLPDLKEQAQIIKRLDSIEKKIYTEQQLLKKYVELKQGLMADLLTGKVEVTTNTHN
ncbi:MAG: restriction endonuclease subunit S [Ignavibacteriales bacterium]|nr:restriction endonuclease subunit S [Ignavibacteriales bacterium]